MIIDRINAVISYSGLSGAQFAKKLGFTQANLWRQLHGQKLNADVLIAIAENYPEINCAWLLKGDGCMTTVDTEADIERREEGFYDIINKQQDTIANLLKKIKQLKKQ